MSSVELGFPEKRGNAALWLSNRYFPSKFGGKPAWLELKELPAKEFLQCETCKGPMSFLCQIYAPGEDEHNFHRSIFVFICREINCQKLNESSNLTVLRSQLPLKNEFYSTEPPAEDGDPKPEIPSEKKLCLACGCPGPFACGRCGIANYCSLKHQRAMWPTHKKNCGSERNEKENNIIVTPPGTIFPEYEIVIEIESNQEHNTENKDSAKREKERLREFEKLAAQGKTGTFKDMPDEELEKYTKEANEADDKFFQTFKKATSNEPEQILRYKRGGAPLWIADVEKTVSTKLANVPNCELCGGKREFEFQIMPQMLLLLKDENLDWGVLAVYTCTKNCKIPKEKGYVKEFIIKQDILSDKK